MQMDAYGIDQCNRGSKANVLHSALRIFMLFFCIVISCLCLPSSQQFNLFPVREIIYAWSCNAVM